MAPTEAASGEPGGEVFETLEKADERFASRVFFIPVIVEATDGDLLRKDALQELLVNTQAVRDDPEIGPKLFSYFDTDLKADVLGVHTIADTVDKLLRTTGVAGIAAARWRRGSSRGGRPDRQERPARAGSIHREPKGTRNRPLDCPGARYQRAG